MFKAQNWYRFRDESKVDGLRESNWTVLRIGNEWSKGMEIEIWAPKLLILNWKLRGLSSLTLTCDRPVWRSLMTLHFGLDSLITAICKKIGCYWRVTLTELSLAMIFEPWKTSLCAFLRRLCSFRRRKRQIWRCEWTCWIVSKFFQFMAV